MDPGPAAAPQTLRFAYVLRDAATGQVIDLASREKPLTWTRGADAFVPGLEAALATLRPGDRRIVRVAANEGYGEPDPTLRQRIPRASLPVDEVTAGDIFQTGPDPRDPIVRIVEVSAEEVLIDANHPLAGVDLLFEIEVLAR